VKVMLTLSADQNTHIQLNGGITAHRKRSFEWSSNWTVTKTSPRTGRLRKRHLELDGSENVSSNWTVKKTSPRTGRLRNRRLELEG